MQVELTLLVYVLSHMQQVDQTVQKDIPICMFAGKKIAFQVSTFSTDFYFEVFTLQDKQEILNYRTLH